jgi:ABC-type antimicrobial peptide transport system permease subunit
MFLSRHILVGALGGALGFCVGVPAAIYFSATVEGKRIWITGSGLYVFGLMVLAVAGAAALAVIAGWIPTIMVARYEPADVLREE